MSPTNDLQGTPAVPQLTVSTAAPPSLAPAKYSTDGSTIVDEKSLTREWTASTPASRVCADPFDTDVEAMLPGGAPDNCPKKSLSCQRPDAECQVWPGKEHWKRKAKAAKVNRSKCGCMARMSKRNRIIVQVLIGLLIIGIAVGVGVGVSKPLGAGIWKANGTTSST